jgi:chloramphenicol-sensitive protein RarD
MWGLLPLYLKTVAFADVREVLGQRILWAIPSAMLALVLAAGGAGVWRELRRAWTPAMLGTLAASGAFLFVNWSLYVWLVMQNRVIESALAYFLAPLVSVGVGASFGERIGPTQWLALALAGAGVLVQGIALGGLPWAALAICASWSVYSVIRKRAAVSASVGLLTETLVLVPAALGLLWWAAGDVGLRFGDDGGGAALLALAGPITAVPLLAFGFGARRVSFVTLGLLQFVAPTLQFLTGLAFGEQFTLLRGLSFVLIWFGLALFAWNSLSRAR